MTDKIAVLLDEAEFRALAGLLDAAVRAGGLRAAKDALAITAKMEAAYEAAHPEGVAED
ncbi:MAG: hypothetical protein V4574_01390 [Pseudomonadota bacterium]